MIYTVISYASPAVFLRHRGFTFEGEVVIERPLPPTIRAIQEVVAAYYRLPLIEMWSDRRAREVARPRQVAIYLAKELTPHSLPEIGRRFGDRDHTTVIHAVRQIEKLCLTDAQLNADVRVLRIWLQREHSRALVAGAHPAEEAVQHRQAAQTTPVQAAEPTVRTTPVVWPLPFEEQLDRVRRGAGISSTYRWSRASPDFTLGGVATGQLG